MEILRPAVTEYLRNIQKIGLPPGVFGGDLSTNMPHAETLVVDDLDEFRNFLCTALQEKTQCKVVDEASDGLQAVQQAEKLQPELILLDVGLPSMNGLQAARRIRELSPALSPASPVPIAKPANRLSKVEKTGSNKVFTHRLRGQF